MKLISLLMYLAISFLLFGCNTVGANGIQDNGISLTCGNTVVNDGDVRHETMVISSNFHGDIGYSALCDRRFSVGYGNYIFSDDFRELRVALWRQRQGERISISVSGDVRFSLTGDPEYPGWASFESIDHWQATEVLSNSSGGRIQN